MNKIVVIIRGIDENGKDLVANLEVNVDLCNIRSILRDATEIPSSSLEWHDMDTVPYAARRVTPVSYSIAPRSVTQLKEFIQDKHDFIIQVGVKNAYYGYTWVGGTDTLSHKRREQVHRALYCYAIGDDRYKASYEEAAENSVTVDLVPADAEVHYLHVNDKGEIE